MISGIKFCKLMRKKSDFDLKKNIIYIFFVVVLQFSIYSDVYLTESKFIWNTGLALEAQVRPRSFQNLFPKISTYINTSLIEPGDLIWVQPDQVGLFIDNYLKNISSPIVLLINTCDDTFPDCLRNPESFFNLLNSKYITHIFCQNCSISNHPKITQIPIGLDLHTLAYGKKAFGEPKLAVPDQESIILKIRSMSLETPKKLIACGDFHFNDSMRYGNQLYKVFGEDRTSIFKKLKDLSCTYFFPSKLPRNLLWQQKIQFAFSLCPPGNGIDTHRLWEDMILGLIPIVKTSPLDPLYKQYPIVIVNDWSEVTESNLQKWYEEFKDAIISDETLEKLQQSYWLNKIIEKRGIALRTPL